MMRRDWTRACDLWEDLRAQAPDILAAHTGGIEALIQAYRFEDAFRLAEKTAERFGGQPDAEMALAVLETRRGHWADAVGRFEALIARSEELADRVSNTPAYRQAVFNAFGILAGSGRLMPALHSTERHPATNRRGYVFVSGMPRAGTTALGHLLNAREDVALFVELHNPYLTYDSSSFAPDVVASKRARLPTVATDQIMERAKTSAYVGDKRPLFHYSLPHTVQVMVEQPVTVVHILRNPFLVAASYQRRAANPDDEWDPLRDMNNCIDEINVMHQFLLDWERKGEMGREHQLIHVDYEKVFRDPEYAMGIFEAIGVDNPGTSRSAIAKFQERSAQVLAKGRTIDPRISAAVASGLDREAALGVATLTGIDILGDFA